MKLISIIGLALFSFAASAQWFGTYKGQVYLNEELAQCEADFAVISDRLESKKEYKIVDGGCVAFGKEKVQIQFNYSHPLAKRIERFEKKLPSELACSQFTQWAKASFAAAGDYPLTSFCFGKELRVDYLNTSRGVIRKMNLAVSYTSENECQLFLEDLSSSLKNYEVTALVPSCKHLVSYNGTKHYFVPQADLSARYTKAVKFLTGKKLKAGAECHDNLHEVSRNFQAKQIDLAMAFCANEKYSEEKREYLAYVSVDRGERVKTFKGIVYTQEAECQIQLGSATGNLHYLGHAPLYKFCEAVSANQFQPVVHYVEKK